MHSPWPCQVFLRDESGIFERFEAIFHRPTSRSYVKTRLNMQKLCACLTSDGNQELPDKWTRNEMCLDSVSSCGRKEKGKRQRGKYTLELRIVIMTSFSLMLFPPPFHPLSLGDLQIILRTRLCYYQSLFSSQVGRFENLFVLSAFC